MQLVTIEKRPENDLFQKSPIYLGRSSYIEPIIAREMTSISPL